MSGGPSQTTRLGISFLGAGAVAVAVLELVSRVAEAFDPRRTVTVGLIVAVALLGLTLQRAGYLAARRARGRQREKLLSEALRSWPPVRCTAADPLTLGVWPARSGLTTGEDRLPPYVPREADSPVSNALRGGGLVLLTGPAGSGKSRTAYEVLRRERPDARMLVPEDAEALSRLIASGELELDPSEVLWLDDLQRFVDQLDSQGLRLLERRDLSILATLRDDSLARLRAADGAAGDRARRLLGAARIVNVPTRLTPGELATAAKLLRGVDVGDGFGAGLSDTFAAGQPGAWQERRAPRDHHEPDDERAPLGGRLRSVATNLDPVLMVAVALTGGVVVALALSVAVDGFSESTRTVGQQIDDIRAEARDDGRRVDALEEAELHGPGIASYVLLLSDDQFSENGRPPELRIYEEQDGELQQRLVFRPATEELRYGRFVINEVTDLDRDDDNDVLASVAANLGSPFHVPLVISWEERLRMYTVVAALPDAAPIPASVTDTSLTMPYEFGSSAAGQPIKGFATSAFAVVPSDEGFLQLLTGVASYADGVVVLTVGASAIGTMDGRIVFERLCNPGVGDSFEHKISDPTTPYAAVLEDLGSTADRELPGLLFRDRDCEYLEG